MPERLQEFKAEFFKALAHPTRIRILERLRDADGTVGDLQRALGLDQSVVSQQLAVLRRQGLVEAEKQGATVRYGVRDATLFQLTVPRSPSPPRGSTVFMSGGAPTGLQGLTRCQAPPTLPAIRPA
jgi:DNA-binding transcriptional ArsR family regulator